MPALTKPQTLQDLLQILAQNVAQALNPGLSQATIIDQIVQVDEPVGETDTPSFTAGTNNDQWGTGKWGLMQWG